VLQVVDSRDLPGDSPAAQTIQVTPTLPPRGDNTRLGGALSAASLLLMGLLGGLTRRRRRFGHRA
jgi:hypothetical protein